MLAEDWGLQFFDLPVQRRARHRAMHSLLKDSLRRGQARRLKGIVCDGEGDEMGNGTEDRVIDFGEEEDRAVSVC